jgi:hypothetical protein
MSDSAKIKELIEIGSNAATLVHAQHAAASKLLHFDGEVYPRDGCAITLSTLLQEAGIDVPDTYQAIMLGRELAKRGWERIAIGNQMTGDVASTCGAAPSHGSDHIFLVLQAMGKDEMVIADNQAHVPHFRWASGKGGKTPVKFFLRAPA